MLETLGNNLIAAYLHGSIVFPGFQPQSGDIDFYVVVRQPLKKTEVRKLGDLHKFLARTHQFGRKLYGFYIPLANARKRQNPTGLVYGANGRIQQGGFDDTWSLHREHFHRSADIILYGPRASEIFPPPVWPQLRVELYKQLHSIRKIVDKDPGYAVLSLSRLIYNFEKGKIAVSKIGAAQWGLKNLPPTWRPLIWSAIKTYRGQARRKDRLLLRRQARRFLGFTSIQMIAMDPTDNPRSPAIAYLRKTPAKKRKEQ